MDEILEVLEKDARTSAEDIAKMLKKSPKEIKKRSRNMRKRG